MCKKNKMRQMSSKRKIYLIIFSIFARKYSLSKTIIIELYEDI